VVIEKKNELALHRTDMRILDGCGVKIRDSLCYIDLRQPLGIEETWSKEIDCKAMDMF